MAKVKNKIQPKTSDELPELSSEEISQFIDFRARKLAVLLATSSLPDDVKEAWQVLLPDMSLDQIDQLTDILEASFLINGTAEIDDYFEQRWNAAVSEFEEEQAMLEKDFGQKVETIEALKKELE